MDEKPKTETLKTLSDSELVGLIETQTSFLEQLPKEDLERYILVNSRYSLGGEDVALEYFGAYHIFTPDHTQFEKIATAFKLFLEGKEPSNVVAFVESSIPAIKPSIEETIHATGERGYLAYLSRERNIEVRCVEPDRVLEMKYLLGNFPADQIAYYYYLRAIRDYFRQGRIQDGTTFEEYSQHLLSGHKRMFGELEEFKDYSFSMGDIENTHRLITGEEFDRNSRLDIDPRKTTTVINAISKASSTFRDFYHVRAIEGALTEGKSVFIVNGKDHAIIQRPALSEMFS